jgi:hypothetical protein
LVGVDERPHEKRRHPGATRFEVLDLGAALFDVPLRQVPPPGIELRQAEVGQPFRPPSVIAALAIPLVLHRVTSSRGLEIVCAAKPDQGNGAFRRGWSCPHLQLQTPLEEPAPLAATEQRLGEEAAEEDVGEQPGLPLLAQQTRSRIRVLDRTCRIARDIERDELRLNPGLEPAIIM